MMRPLFDIHAIKEQIKSGALVLTSTDHLAIIVRESWGQHQIDLGNTSWPEPKIFAIERWINETWLRCCDSGKFKAPNYAIVSELTEHVIWEKIIADSFEVLTPGNYSGLARDSYNIMQRWGIPCSKLKDNAPLFYLWISEFKLALKNYHFITEADTAQILTSLFKDKKIKNTADIITLGFDQIPPLYQNLIKAASKKIIREPLKCRHRENARVPTKYIEFFDINQEIRAAAKWAKKIHTEYPEHRIGVILSDSALKLKSTQRILSEEINSTRDGSSYPKNTSRYKASIGIKLSDTPIISTALLLLSGNVGGLNLEEYCRLLNSPFWGKSYSLSSRAVAEKYLRKKALLELSIAQFIRELKYSEKKCVPIDDDSLRDSSCYQEANGHMKGVSKKNYFSVWLTLFQKQLDFFGWPGSQNLNVKEDKLQKEWFRSLEILASLDQLKQKVTIEEALRQLSQTTDRYIFERNDADAPIHIMGLLESNALKFDHLWVTGMDDASWPNRNIVNSLIPIDLQRQYVTPKSSPEEQLKLAKKQLERLKVSSADTIFSFSGTKDSKSFKISPLIYSLERMKVEDLNIHDSLLNNPIYEDISTIKLEEIKCINGPIVNLDKEDIAGGSSILKNQASCPFNAFAIHRLGAKEVQPPSFGLSNMERGIIIHKCMQVFWEKTCSQQRLISLTKKGLNEAIMLSVCSVLDEWRTKRPDIMRSKYVSFETQRLSTLILHWLNIEKERMPFTTWSLEKSEATYIGRLPLKLTIDRIDRIDNGENLVIDYKTGNKCKTSTWDGDRPIEPQVPLYALLGEAKSAGVAFGQINISSQGFIGFTKTAYSLPGVMLSNENWDDRIARWKDSLEHLSEEFMEGFAVVGNMNKSSSKLNQYLTPLNRLNEKNMELYMENKISISKKQETSS